MYEHMGMLCCHVLKVQNGIVFFFPFNCSTFWRGWHDLETLVVMAYLFALVQVLVHLRFKWTVDARDVLPMHLVHYQKDQGLMTSFSFRHSQLYLNCMEVARLGDVNVDAYTMAMDFIKVLVPKLKKVAVQGDGLGLEERLAAKKARVDGAAAQMVVQYQLYFFLRAWICVTASTNTWMCLRC
jgi:hypothetical protein